MNSGLRMGPPKHTLPQTSGSRMRPTNGAAPEASEILQQALDVVELELRARRIGEAAA